ncbi:sugar transferase, partial [Candidatus Zixiibacteriota bacterium]
PGMTGLSQVSGGNELNWDKRIIVDVYFVRNRNILMYIDILLRTILGIFKKTGIYTAAGNVKGWTRPVPYWYRDSSDSDNGDNIEGVKDA